MLLLAVMAVSLGAAGCGNASSQPSTQAMTLSPESTACSSDTAQILVGDSFLQTLCGCTGVGESAGTVFEVGSTLTCHLASPSTTVFFTFVAVGLRHQIIPLQEGTFTESAIFDPQNPTYRSFAVLFAESGTYGFGDRFVASVTGNIIVP